MVEEFALKILLQKQSLRPVVHVNRTMVGVGHTKNFSFSMGELTSFWYAVNGSPSTQTYPEIDEMPDRCNSFNSSADYNVKTPSGSQPARLFNSPQDGLLPPEWMKIAHRPQLSPHARSFKPSSSYALPKSSDVEAEAALLQTLADLLSQSIECSTTNSTF